MEMKTEMKTDFLSVPKMSFLPNIEEAEKLLSERFKRPFKRSENGGRAVVPLVQFVPTIENRLPNLCELVQKKNVQVVPTIENRAQQTELIELETPEAYQSQCTEHGFDPEFAKITARFWFGYLPEWTEIHWAYIAIEDVENELAYLQWLCDKIRCVQPNNYSEQRQIKTWVQEVILRQFVPITELATDWAII